MKNHQKQRKFTLVFDGIRVAFSHPLGLTEGKGGNGMKRKNQDDEPATRAKRLKGDVSRGHQAAAQPTKKAQPKKNLGKKKN